MENITGVVKKIVYSNTSNNFAIVNITIDFTDSEMKKYEDILFSNLLTVTCNYDRLPVVGEEFNYTGNFIETKYGIQLKATSFSRSNLDTIDGVVTYLSSDYFPGIGKVIAKKIYDTLGKNCLKLIKDNKEVLDKVPGLTNKQKETIFINLVENSKNENTLVNITNLGFSIGMAQKIIDSIPKKEINNIFTNPYILIDKVPGIGFVKADSIALGMGITKNDPRRLEACIRFILNNFIYETGNTYIDYSDLKKEVFNILNEDNCIITDSQYDEFLNDLKIHNKIFIDESNNVYDLVIHHAENNLATILTMILKSEQIETSNKEEIYKAFNETKKELKIDYSELQEKAIIKAIEENIVIITGGPGTGKTTIIKGIINTFSKLHKDISLFDDIFLLAPTGRAGKRLNEVTNHPALTIHKFLGYDGHRYMYGEGMKVNAKMVIIDEMSMVDVDLAYRLFSALNDDCKVVIVGDSDQIPSVGPGEVLYDLIRTKEFSIIHLDKIHRQAENSSIISLAHSINSGIIPENIKEKRPDKLFLSGYDNSVINNIIKTIKSAIKSGLDLLKDIQVLIPMYRGELGIDNINKVLQDEFNPLDEKNEELVTSKSRFRIGDKVIQLVNRNEDQIMNGDIGEVISFSYINGNINTMTVLFDNKTIDYNGDQFDDLKLAYAISIHKSQGSEFTTVIIPLSKKYYPMLKRKLYYTAITRAKDFLVLIGDVSSLSIATTHQVPQRKTKLYDLIKERMGKKELSPYDFLSIPPIIENDNFELQDDNIENNDIDDIISSSLIDN